MDLANEQFDADYTEDWTRPVDAILSGGETYRSHSNIGNNDHSLNHTSESELCTSKLGHTRTVIHIDVDCFYAQVEMIRNPSLRNKPLGIQQKYLVVTCNYKAREYGVTKLMGIKEAMEKCPQLILVSGEDLTHYREMSYKISEFLQKFTPYVERLGMDENYLDVSSIAEQRLKAKDYSEEVKGHSYGVGEKDKGQGVDTSYCRCGCYTRLLIGSQIASDIRQALYEELGITCCAGISYNKLLAKLVGEKHKPNQQTTLFPQFSNDFIVSLPKASKIPGIGWTTAKKLAELGIKEVTDLQEFSLCDLKKEFSEVLAVTMKQLSFGIDDSLVTKFGKPQTLSDEDSFKKCSSESEARLKIRQLLSNLVKRLVEDGRIANTLRVTVRKMTTPKKYSNRESRQTPIPSHIISKVSADKMPQAVSLLEDLSMTLFVKLVDISKPFHLTLINVAFCNLQEKIRNSISHFFSPKKKSESGLSTKPSGDEETESRSSLLSSSESSTIAEPDVEFNAQRESSSVSIAECDRRNEDPSDSLQTGGHPRFLSQQGKKRKTDYQGQSFFAKKSKVSPSSKCLINKCVMSPDKPSGKSVEDESLCHTDKTSNEWVQNVWHKEKDLTVQGSPSYSEDRGQGSHSILCVNSEEENSMDRKQMMLNDSQVKDKDFQSKYPLEHSSAVIDSNNVLVNSTVVNNMGSTNPQVISVPPGIDAEVFNSLPADIKQEVMQQYGRTPSVAVAKPVLHSGTTKHQVNKKQSNKSSSNNNILRYFKVDNKKN